MNKCRNCQNYVEPDSVYCWFHHIKISKINIIQKWINKKEILYLIPDLLLIVFEYVGYENYQIFNFLEPKLTLDLLKQKIIELDTQMYCKCSKFIKESIMTSIEYEIMIHRESKNNLNYDYYERINSEKMETWCRVQIAEIIRAYKDIDSFDLVNMGFCINEDSIFYHIKTPESNTFIFDIENYKFNELSNFWKLIYQVLEINKEYRKIRNKMYLK